MGIRGEIHSEKLEVAEGKRTYFFNVKENRNGDRFLVLAENVFKFDDRVDRQQVVVYEEHLDDFRYALNKAITALKAAAEEGEPSGEKKFASGNPKFFTEKKFDGDKSSGAHDEDSGEHTSENSGENSSEISDEHSGERSGEKSYEKSDEKFRERSGDKFADKFKSKFQPRSDQRPYQQRSGGRNDRFDRPPRSFSSDRRERPDGHYGNQYGGNQYGSHRGGHGGQYGGGGYGDRGYGGGYGGGSGSYERRDRDGAPRGDRPFSNRPPRPGFGGGPGGKKFPPKKFPPKPSNPQ